MAVPMPTPATRWRCSQCGNLTRFDVVRSSRVREFVHFNLAGEPRVEETEVLAQTVEQVHCRWCAGTDTVEIVQRLDAAAGSGPGDLLPGRDQSADTR